MTLTRGPRSDAADAITVLLLGIGAAVTVVLTVTARFLDVFRDAGVAWRIDIDDEPFSASVGSGTGYVDGIVQTALVIAPEVDGGTAAALAGSVVAWGITCLAVIAAVMYVARSFLRGRFFVPATARAFDVIGWALVGGGFVVLVLENIGRNGILTALGVDEVEPLHFLDFWQWAPVWAVGVTVGLIAVAFRRGVRLQRDTEGLV